MRILRWSARGPVRHTKELEELQVRVRPSPVIPVGLCCASCRLILAHLQCTEVLAVVLNLRPQQPFCCRIQAAVFRMKDGLFLVS